MRRGVRRAHIGEAADVVARARGPQDDEFVRRTLNASWGSELIVSRGRRHDASHLPGFVAELGGERAGLLTFEDQGDEMEIVSLDSAHPRRGVGAALLDAATRRARERRARRLWLVTSNDNVEALRFYQRRGGRVTAVRPDAIDQARRLKPEIPQMSARGVPIRDEVEIDLI